MHREVKAEGGWAGSLHRSLHDPSGNRPAGRHRRRLYDEGDVINHRHMTDSVHKWGALAGVEFCHAGGLSNDLGSRYVSPAAHQFATPWIPQVYTYEAEDCDLPRIVAMFAEAAKRAIDAGFDILYLHGTHGALPVQMLSRHHNRRTGRYGGGSSRTGRGCGSRSSKRCARRRTANAPSRRAFRSTSSRVAGVEALMTACASSSMSTRLGLVDLWDINISSLEEWGEDAGPRASTSPTTRRRGRAR